MKRKICSIQKPLIMNIKKYMLVYGYKPSPLGEAHNQKKLCFSLTINEN